MQHGLAAAYLPRAIDEELVRAISQWNTAPERRRAHWFLLPYEPDTGSHELLRQLFAQLPQRGITPVLIDAQQQFGPEVPGPLAWSLYSAVTKQHLWRTIRALRDFAALRVPAKIIRVTIGFSLAAAGLVISEFLNYLSNTKSGQFGFHDFRSNYLPQQWQIAPLRAVFQYLGVAGLLTIVLALRKAFSSGPVRWTSEAKSSFEDHAGYTKAVRHIAAGGPVALLLDNAMHLPMTEKQVLNRWLKDESFIGVFVSVGYPRGVITGKIELTKFAVPKLPAEILARAQSNRTRVEKAISEQLSDDEGRAVAGVIGPYEWNAFCALLDRRVISPEEMRGLYQATLSSPVLPVLGLTGPHPDVPPETSLRDPGTAQAFFDPVYCEREVAVVSENRPALLARARFMLLAPGLDLITQHKNWREWTSDSIRTVLFAADQVAELTDAAPPKQLLKEALAGPEAARLNLLEQAMRVLVTGAEIHRAYGNLARSTDYLQSAMAWYGVLEERIEHRLRDRYFYLLWKGFWLSWEIEERDRIFAFEASHSAVAQQNSWRILRGYENYKSRKHLWESRPVDPGNEAPELANILRLAESGDILIRTYGGDRDEAAKDAVFSAPAYQHELFATEEGLILLWRNLDIRSRRGEISEGVDRVFGRELIALRARTKPEWLSHISMIDYEDSYIEYRRLQSESFSQPEVAAFLNSRLAELRERALILGFNDHAIKSSELLAWLILERTKLLPEAERPPHMVTADTYFQEAISREAALSWCLSTLDDLEKRIWEFGALSGSSVVDDQVALYLVMKNAGVPAQKLRTQLRMATTALTNHGTTTEHRRQQAILTEDEVRDMLLSQQESSGTIAPPPDEATAAILLIFAVVGWFNAGDPEEAERVLHEAERFQNRFAEQYPQADRTREAKVAVILMRAVLSQEFREQEASLVSDAWRQSRPTDFLACWAVRQLIRGEAALGLLAETNSKEWFIEQLSHPYFVLDNTLLSRHDGKLTRLNWRLLQILSNRTTLQVGGPSFHSLVLRLAEAAGGIPLDQECYQALLLLLAEAEAYFHAEDASNAQERRAIELRIILDSASADTERHLAEVAAEERQLQYRSEKLHDVMQQSDWLSSFLALDTRKKSFSKAGFVTSAYLEVTSLVTMFSDGHRETLLNALTSCVAAVHRESPRPIDLIIFRLYLLVIQPQDREPMQREFNQLVGNFIGDYMVTGREEAAASLRDRLSEWANGLGLLSAHTASGES